MRRMTLVASAMLTIAFAMAAMPEIGGLRARGPDRLEEAAALRPVLPATLGRSIPTIGRSEAASRSANRLGADGLFSTPGGPARRPVARPRPSQPASRVKAEVKPPRYTLRGYATWYDNGTTAMRIPRGTTVRICGPGGCVERIVSDYGPHPGFRPVRIVDLMPSDFVKVCGCALGRGTVFVEVGVY